MWTFENNWSRKLRGNNNGRKNTVRSIKLCAWNIFYWEITSFSETTLLQSMDVKMFRGSRFSTHVSCNIVILSSKFVCKQLFWVTTSSVQCLLCRYGSLWVIAMMLVGRGLKSLTGPEIEFRLNFTNSTVLICTDWSHPTAQIACNTVKQIPNKHQYNTSKS